MDPVPQSETARSALGGGAPLKPAVGLITAAAIVVGEVIGAGIFLTPNEVARHLGGAVALILWLWLICGLINLCGALAMAELSAMMPHAGGTYVFLREAYGRPWAFLWSWAEFWVVRSGSTAAMATAMTISLVELLRQSGVRIPSQAEGWLQSGVAAAAVLLLTAVNVAGVRWGGAVQVLTTVAKVVFVAFLGLLPLAAAFASSDPGSSFAWHPFGGSPFGAASIEGGHASGSLWLGVGGALAAMMFTYDGWGNVTVIAEEIRNPGRNLPRALAGGVVLLIVLYLGANLACHASLTADEIVRSPVPTVTATEKLLPGLGGRLVLVMMIVSIFGAMNGNVLVGARVLFATARDHAALGRLGRIDPRFGTPAWATWALSLWTVALILLSAALSGEKRLFEILVAYCTFGGSMFYLLAVLAVFVLRKKMPQAPRPYRTWGYPFVPAIFAGFYCFLLTAMFWANWVESFAGLALIASGLAFYPLLSKR